MVLVAQVATHLGALLPGCHVHYRLLNPKGRNEDVDHHDDEYQSRGQVVKEVQLGVLGWVVKVILDCGQEEVDVAQGSLDRIKVSQECVEWTA